VAALEKSTGTVSAALDKLVEAAGATAAGLLLVEEGQLVVLENLEELPLGNGCCCGTLPATACSACGSP
jgi:hypothetical protein